MKNKMKTDQNVGDGLDRFAEKQADARIEQAKDWDEHVRLVEERTGLEERDKEVKNDE